MTILYSEARRNLLHNRSMNSVLYGQSMDSLVSFEQTEGTIPVITSIRKDGPVIKYGPSRLKDKAFYSTPKVIVCALEYNHCYNDFAAEYGVNGPDMSAISLESDSQGEAICALLRSDYWASFHMAMNYSTFKLDLHLFRQIDWSEENIRRLLDAV